MKKSIMLILAICLFFVPIGIKLAYFSEETSSKPASVEATPHPSTSGETEGDPEDTQPHEPSEQPTIPEPTVVPTPQEEDTTLRIMAVGDVFLGRGVEYHLTKNNKSFNYPFEKVHDILKEGDIIYCNLEAPFTDSTHGLAGIDEEGGKYCLKNKPEAFEGVKYAGFNLVSLANNHILDYYERGLFDTIRLLEENSIAYAGAGSDLDEARKPAIIEKKGVKVGMLSYTDMAEVLYKGNPPLRFVAGEDKAGVAPRKLEYIKEDIEKLRDKVDILIVTLHWGVEYEYYVLPEQVEFAHHVMDLGADIIIGSHPHRMKGIEIYKGKPIVYSLGNFISDQNDPRNQEGFILDFEFENKKLKSLSGIPFTIFQKMQVVPLEGEEAQALLETQLEWSRKLNSKCYIKDNRIVYELT